MNTVIAQSPNPATPGLVVTLEGTNLFVSIVVSLSVLIGLVVRLVSQFNSVANDIKDLREDLTTHSRIDGHEKACTEIRQIQQSLIVYDKKLDLHLLAYVYDKDSGLLIYNGLRENINHVWSKTDKLLIEHKSEIKELQRFLQKSRDFNIRE